jgi:hypothetical protein
VEEKGIPIVCAVFAAAFRPVVVISYYCSVQNHVEATCSSCSAELAAKERGGVSSQSRSILDGFGYSTGISRKIHKETTNKYSTSNDDRDLVWKANRMEQLHLLLLLKGIDRVLTFSSASNRMSLVATKSIMRLRFLSHRPRLAFEAVERNDYGWAR